jgi:hypothetical protein
VCATDIGDGNVHKRHLEGKIERSQRWAGFEEIEKMGQGS